MGIAKELKLLIKQPLIGQNNLCLQTDIIFCHHHYGDTMRFDSLTGTLSHVNEVLDAPGMMWVDFRKDHLLIAGKLSTALGFLYFWADFHRVIWQEIFSRLAVFREYYPFSMSHLG